MKNCRTSLFLFACIALLCSAAMADDQPAQTLLTSGRVDGPAYKNSYLGLEYFIPADWAAHGTPAKLPGAGNGQLLLTLKRKQGEQLSSIMLSVAQLNEEGGNLQSYLEKRYRRRDDSADFSDTTINGIAVTRTRRTTHDPEQLVIAGRTFYRIDTESGGITRVSMATEQRGYAIVFELVVPRNAAESTVTNFIDSMYALTFSASPAK